MFQRVHVSHPGGEADSFSVNVRLAPEVEPVQVRAVAGAVPPATAVSFGTGGGISVVVGVLRTELLSITGVKRAAGVSCRSSYEDPVLVVLAGESHREVLDEAVFALEVGHVDAQLLRVAGRQAMDQLVAQPELAGDVAEAVAVVLPVAVEVDLLRVVLTSLEHRPAAAGSLHVAEEGHRRPAGGQLDPVLTAGGNSRRGECQIVAVGDDTLVPQLRPGAGAEARHTLGRDDVPAALGIRRAVFTEGGQAGADGGEEGTDGGGGGVVASSVGHSAERAI